MKITDEMKAAAFKAAKDREPGCRDAECVTPESGNCQCWNVANAALTAALATQPDRYAQGFDRAREMAARTCETQEDFAESVDEKGALYTAWVTIRSMEMPDE